MHARSHRPSRPRTIALAALLILAPSLPLFAQQTSALHGEVRDPLGAVIVDASVELLSGDEVVATAATGADGSYQFSISASGRYSVRASAPAFQKTSSAAVYLTPSSHAEIDVTLATQTIAQQITVTANGTPTPLAQVGSAVTVLLAGDYRYSSEVQDPLRWVPGVQVTQSGEMGGTTALSIRGGSTSANKVLIDGVPANAIGGGVEYSNLATVGLQSIEVLREPNSALYGSDALAGVISLTTTRGGTRLPLFTYAGDAGNFGTYRNEVTAGGQYRQFDYYSAFARIDTSNNIPLNQFHNATYAGNFGWTPNTANDLRFTVRHIIVAARQPNSIAFFGIPDDAEQRERDNYYSAVWNNQTTSKWHNQVRYGGLRSNPNFITYGATGIFDPVNDVWDGAVVTIKGANGYSVTGQAVFQYSDQYSQYLTPTSRDIAYAQTDYRINPHIVALGAFKFEHESGGSGYAGSPLTTIDRDNYSYTVQISGDLRNRLFYNLGSGLEDNGLFGFAASPRAALAYYLVRPSGSGFFTGTKLHGTFGKGIKEPSIYQQTNSLFGVLSLLPNGGELIRQYNVSRLGPEQSRTFDAGVDQLLLNGRARVNLTWFHNQFTNGVEYVPPAGLLELGVPAADLPSFQYSGAYLNSSAFRSLGAEIETEFQITSHILARGGYTYTDAVVQHSFSSDNLTPAYNTSFNFADIPIGAFSPLTGARPFRVAPHTGYFGIQYTHSKLYASFTGTLVGRRDDSDYLSDSNFGNSLLLPNRNLLGSYQRLELGGGYQLTPRINLYTNIQNLLSQHYFEAFGYPALPLTFRSGIKINFGGESWSLK